MRTDRQKQLLEKLQRVLCEQNDLARQGKLSQVEALCERTGGLIEEISRAGILKLDEFARQRKQLADTYENLRLTLSDQRDQTARELNQILASGKQGAGKSAWRRLVRCAFCCRRAAKRYASKGQTRMSRMESEQEVESVQQL